MIRKNVKTKKCVAYGNLNYQFANEHEIKRSRSLNQFEDNLTFGTLPIAVSSFLYSSDEAKDAKIATKESGSHF